MERSMSLNGLPLFDEHKSEEADEPSDVPADDPDDMPL
jgi:hypothetical protein